LIIFSSIVGIPFGFGASSITGLAFILLIFTHG
jgi:hypothetical protein